MAQLTGGAIQQMVSLTIAKNTAAMENFLPVVQVTAKRKVTANGSERLKVELSDGQHSLPGILASEICHTPAVAELQKNDIISLERWSVQELHRQGSAATQGSGATPHLIFLYAFTTVERAPAKIGNPVKFASVDRENAVPVQQSGQQMQQSNVNSAYGAPPAGAYGQPPNGMRGQAPGSAYGQPPAGMTGYMQQQQQQPPPMAANSMYGAPPGGAYGQPASQHSATGKQRGALPASLSRPKYDQNRGATMHNSASTNIVRISDITPYISRWTARGRCSSKSEIRRYNRNGKAGCVFNFDLLDSSGEVRVVAFGDSAEKWEPQVKMGTFYEISKVSAKVMDAGKRKWNQTGHNCEVYLEQNSELSEITEAQPDVPKIHLKPVKLAEVEALPTETFVDVVAVLDSCQDLGLIQRRDGSEGKKRSLVVRDDSGRSIEVTLWGEKAETVGAEIFEQSRAGQHPVLVIKSARIGEFNGKNLSTVGSSMVIVDDPTIPGVPEMQQWYASGGAATPAQALSRSGGGRADRRVTSTIVQDERLGSGGVTAWVKVVGVLTGAGGSGVLTYPACRLDYNGRQCNKKVTADGEGGMFFCARCQQTCEPMYRYLLNLQFLDFTGPVEGISVFGELGDTVMGLTAEEAHQSLEDDSGEAQTAWLTQHVLWRPRALKVKCSEDTYNDETRLKYTLQTIEELDFASDSTKLCEMIDDLMCGRPVKAMQPPPPKQGGFAGGSPGGFGGQAGGMQVPGMMGMPQGTMGGPPMGGGFMVQDGMAPGVGGPMVGQGGYVSPTQGQWNAPGGGNMAPGGHFPQGAQFQGQYGQMPGGQAAPGQFQGTQQYGGPYQGMTQQGMHPQGMMQQGMVQQGMPQQGMQPGMNGMQQPNMAFIDQPTYGPR